MQHINNWLCDIMCIMLFIFLHLLNKKMIILCNSELEVLPSIWLNDNKTNVFVLFNEPELKTNAFEVPLYSLQQTLHIDPISARYQLLCRSDIGFRYRPDIGCATRLHIGPISAIYPEPIWSRCHADMHKHAFFRLKIPFFNFQS